MSGWSIRKPKIISIGYAVPRHLYDQKDIFDQLQYPNKFWKIFDPEQSCINTRQFVLPIWSIRKLSFQGQQEAYLREAPALSMAAVKNCLDGRTPQDIGLLVYGSCTGLAPGPTIAHYLARDLQLSPSTFYTNIIGQGCESGFPGLKRAYDFVVATGKQALVVNCELSCLTYFPEDGSRPDPENHFELLRSNSIFADAASAELVGYDDDLRHPEIIDMETYTNTEFLGDLGYTWRGGRLRVLLSRRVPELAPLVVAPAVDAVLQRQALPIDAIRWWVIHAAGTTVIDNIRDALHISEDKTKLSRATLRLYGNTSSTSVSITGKHLMGKNIRAGDYVAVLSVGPGMSGGMTLLRFSEIRSISNEHTGHRGLRLSRRSPDREAVERGTSSLQPVETPA